MIIAPYLYTRLNFSIRHRVRILHNPIDTNLNIRTNILYDISAVTATRFDRFMAAGRYNRLRQVVILPDREIETEAVPCFHLIIARNGIGRYAIYRRQRDCIIDSGFFRFHRRINRLIGFLAFIFGSSDISSDSFLKRKTAEQIVYLNCDQQMYSYEQQFSISCLGSLYPQMHS